MNKENDSKSFCMAHICMCCLFTCNMYCLYMCLSTGASALDPEMCGRYKLSVMVQDMGGRANAFFSTGTVLVEVTGNTWASPDPVRLQENLPGPYPIPISQVRHTHTVCTHAYN